MFILYVLISFFMTVAHAQAPLAPVKKNVMDYDSAKDILDNVLYQPVSPSIITEHEWKEFQLDRLITILDRTKTSFGRWGLAQLLQPIANSHELAQRKDIITFLIEHPKELAVFQEQLSKMHEGEESLLAYWDRSDAVDKSAQQFYYSFPGIKENLNDSTLALNGSVGMQMFSAFNWLFLSLGLSGLQAERIRWIGSDKKDEKYDWGRAIREGFSEPIRQHYPGLNMFKKNSSSYEYTAKDVEKAYWGGSWGDLYQASAHRYGMGLAFLGATGRLIFHDYNLAMSISSVVSSIISMNKTLNQLYDRVIDVATCFNTIKNINKTIKKYPEIADNHYTNIEYNAQADDCLKKLAAPRFAQKGSYLYSRGHVLSMHREIKQVKRSLIPVLQSIAFLDAYCSIAQLYTESQQEPVKFSFPEFVPSRTPLFSYENAWLPLLAYKHAVTNDLCLGDNCPGKIIITGPNGGGKSTILKTYGVAAILAQSWFIVPATHGSQTLFAEIKTGLAPHEDLEQGLSTFMAEKKRMQELFEAMQENDAHKKNTLVLIDEPYKGTVDAESAKRIYQFGKDIAKFSHVLVAVATHVKKPIALAVDTQGVFGNYQVKINEVSPGIFERLFKMEKGPATWWFEDADKRSRFVDWISGSPSLTEEQKKQAEDEKRKKWEKYLDRLSDYDKKIIYSKHSQ